MVKRSSLWVFIAFSMFTFNCYSGIENNGITLNAKNKTIQYGKYLNLYLKIRKDITPDIKSFLAPLNQIFYYSIIPLDDNRTHRIYKIKASIFNNSNLYIPALKWKNFSTIPIKIDVSQPLSSQKQPIEVKLSKINFLPWEREQTKIMVNVITSDKNIIINSKNIVKDGVESYQLKPSTIKLVTNGEVKYKHTIGWAVYFLFNQKTKITLPDIEYLKNSVPRYKFNFKQLSFNVNKLPVYISPTTPVGKIKLAARYIGIPKYFMQPKSTAVIQYTLSGAGIPAKWLPSIAQLYNTYSQSNIQYSPLATELQTAITSHNVLGTKKVDIAFTPIGNGFSPFEDINMQYFNPETGKLHTLIFKHRELLILNWFFQLLLFLLFSYIAFLTISSSIKLFTRLLHQYKYQHLFLHSVKNAISIYGIKESLSLFSNAEKWPSNLSINKWLQRYGEKYYVTTNMVTIFNKINNGMYSKIKSAGSEEELKALKNRLYNEVKNRKKRKVHHRVKVNLTYLSRYFPT